MRHFVAALLFLVSFAAYATSQIPDVLVINGKPHDLYSQPFASLLRSKPEIEEQLADIDRGSCTASWFGFRATWEVIDDRLYLIGLIADPCADKPTEVPLDLLPGFMDGRVAATWFSGRLVIPKGELVEYVHMGFESRYESYLVLTIKDGLVVATEEQDQPPGRNP